MTKRFLLGLALAAALNAQNPAVQVVVTAEPMHDKTAPAVTQADVQVSSGKSRLDVLDWVPATGEHAALQIYLLIDDSADSSLGTQLDDLRKFIQGLPASASIGIGYMRNGTVQVAQRFTPDHAEAAKKLRLPLGFAGASANPYFSVSDVIKSWSDGASRREILLVSDGVDRYYGGGPDNPYVQAAYRDAQKAGISVSSIYWGGAGHFSHNYFRLNWGQNYLSQIADETGGEAYWQGFGNPVSFAPFLDNFTRRLENQYLLTFRAPTAKKAGAERIHVSTELKGVELVAPNSVWVPAPR